MKAKPHREWGCTCMPCMEWSRDRIAELERWLRSIAEYEASLRGPNWPVGGAEAMALKGLEVDP